MPVLKESRKPVKRADEPARQRISNPYDARAQRSREALRSACLELIEVKSFETITIRDITTEAGVSYPVFFRQFASKEQLLENIAEAEVRQLLGLTRPAFENEGATAPFEGLCLYVQAHRKLWTTLLTAGAASIMRREFMRISKEIAQGRPRSAPWLPLDLSAALVVGTIFEILAWWLQQPEDYPVENVRTLLEVFVTRGMKKPRDVRLIPSS